MMDGMIASYEGRMILCGIFAFIGLIFSGGLTLVTHARKGLPLTTQTNTVTGVREHGIFRWFLTFAAFLVGPWALLMVALTGTHYTLMMFSWLGRNWWLPLIIGVLGIVVLAFALLIRRDAHSDRQERAQLAALPQSAPMPAVALEAMWAMPQVGTEESRD